MNKLFSKSVHDYYIEFYCREYTKLCLNNPFENFYLLLVELESQIPDSLEYFFVRKHY